MKKNEWKRLIGITVAAALSAGLLLTGCAKEEEAVVPEPPAGDEQIDMTILEQDGQETADAADAGKDEAVTDGTGTDATAADGAADETGKDVAAAEDAGTAEDEASADKGSAGQIPPYEYPGPELFYTILYQYLIDEYGPNYPDADVCIPCPVIVALDESNKEDILVYGDFWVLKYDLDGDTLMNTSGGSYPGVIHLKSSDTAGYEVTGMEVVADGSDFTPSAKKIFGKYYDEFTKINSDEKLREETRAQIIANYVAANDLSIKAYQDYGWDPVPLPEENIDSFYSILN